MTHWYRDFLTQEALDEAYDAWRTADPEVDYRGWFVRESALTRSSLACELDVPFGPTRAEYLDIFPAQGAASPVFVFVHGGYWKSLTAKEFSFAARGPVSAGVSTVVVNYALCPSVRMEEIVRQVRASIAWIWENATAWGGDPSRIHVAGHSAGAHLAAMALAADWEREYRLPQNPIKSALALSGIYDLTPLPHTSVQGTLRLTWDEIMRISAIDHFPESAGPIVVAYGERESAEFRRQSTAYLERWREHGLDGSELMLRGKDHFSVLDGFLDADSELCSALLGPVLAGTPHASPPTGQI